MQSQDDPEASRQLSAGRGASRVTRDSTLQPVLGFISFVSPAPRMLSDIFLLKPFSFFILPGCPKMTLVLSQSEVSENMSTHPISYPVFQPSTHPPIHPPSYLATLPPLHLFACLPTLPPTHPSTSLSIHLPARPLSSPGIWSRFSEKDRTCLATLDRWAW